MDFASFSRRQVLAFGAAALCGAATTVRAADNRIIKILVGFPQGRLLTQSRG